MSNQSPVSRRMWTFFEPVHVVTYFAPEARAAFEDAGLRGFWRGYFAGRAAPLGRVRAEPVTASFFTFAPPMVARALPGVWDLATPDDALAARSAGATAALRCLLGESAAGVTGLADRLMRAADGLDCAGRVLAAANTALPVPGEPLARLWHAATLLREHRGDGHFAALLAADIDGCEAVVLRAGIDADRGQLQPVRGWTDEQWDEATDRLTHRGWLDPNGRPTDAGRERIARIEATTDALAAGPWQALGDDLRELPGLLRPLAAAAFAVMPNPNPVGLTLPTGIDV
jgi:hypothetical protein